MDQLKTVFDGEEVVHRLLWKVVGENVNIALEREQDFVCPSIVARVFAYHTVEAYLNYVGERIAPEIWGDERNYFRHEPYRGQLGKLRKILDLVCLSWTPDQRPLKTVLELKEIRDLIAHGKAEKLQGEATHSFDSMPPYPISTLREHIVPKETLALVLPDVEEFLDTIHEAAKPLLKVDDPFFGDKALQGSSWHVSSDVVVTSRNNL